MGKSNGGGISGGIASLHSNHSQALTRFDSKNGRLGFTGKSNNPARRVMFSDDPAAQAINVFNYLRQGSRSERTDGLATIHYFRDGSSVSYRPTSSSGSPAIEIHLKANSHNSGGLSNKSKIRYRIHFESKKG